MQRTAILMSVVEAIIKGHGRASLRRDLDIQVRESCSTTSLARRHVIQVDQKCHLRDTTGSIWNGSTISGYKAQQVPAAVRCTPCRRHRKHRRSRDEHHTSAPSHIGLPAQPERADVKRPY